MLLVPERATDLHLQILSELAQMFSDKAMRDELPRADAAAATGYRRLGAQCPRSASPAV